MDLRSHHGRETLGELMGVFTTNARRLVSKISDAVETKDAVGLEEAAHALKGSAAIFGAARMAELCARLETLDATTAPNDASTLVEELERALEPTQSALREELDR